MIRDTSAPNEPEPRPGESTGSRDSIDDIVQRLDDLLLAMAELPSAAESGPEVDDGMIEAARKEWRSARARERIFGDHLFVNPAWDILLDLFIAEAEHREVTAFSTLAATSLPEAVVLRTISHLVESKLIVRQPHSPDPRQIYLMLSREAIRLLCDYFNRSAAGQDAVAA